LHCIFFPVAFTFFTCLKIIHHLLHNYPSIAYLFLYIFSCFLFPVPSQYLLNNLNFSLSLLWRRSSHKKYIAFPLFFFFSIYCLSSVLLYTSTGINIQFGLFDLLFVFSTLNSTLRFSIFPGF
jgi:hypothetical protein